MQTKQEENFQNACKEGNIQQVQEMLILNLDFNAKDLEGWTPFSLACENGNKELVELLLKDERIDVNTPNNNRKTPFAVACSSGNKEIVELLLQDPRIDVNTPNNNAQTPFAVACRTRNKEIVELLLQDPRIDVNKAYYYGWTPFSWSCYNGHKEIVELLLQYPSIDLSKKLARATVLDPFIYKNLGEALCSAADKILSSSKDFSSVASASKICTLIGNIKAILYPNKNDENYARLEVAQSKIFQYDGEKTINDLKAKLKIAEPALALTMMALLSDGFVTIKENAPDKIKKFFEIAQKLPIEMQMEIASKMFPDAPNTVSVDAVDWATLALFLSFEPGIEVAGDAS